MINHHNTTIQRRQNDAYLLGKDPYLLCFHVKPASLFCGVIILIMSFMNIIILLSKFSVDYNPTEKDASNLNQAIDPRLKTNKLIILYIIAESLKLLISSLLIYGITKCKPSYLFPFFLMQLFYFFRSISFFLEHYANYQAYQNTVYRGEGYESSSKSQNEQSYPMLIFFFSLIYKLYFISCVFKCYKYLKIKEATMQINQNFQFRQHNQPTNATVAILHHQNQPPSYNDCFNEVRIITKDDTDYCDQKLPSYDEACKIVLQDQEKNESTNNTNITTNVVPNQVNQVINQVNNQANNQANNDLTTVTIAEPNQSTQNTQV